jgi:hypothetical protein
LSSSEGTSGSNSQLEIYIFTLEGEQYKVFVFLRSLRRLQVTAYVVPNPSILITLMM